MADVRPWWDREGVERQHPRDRDWVAVRRSLPRSRGVAGVGIPPGAEFYPPQGAGLRPHPARPSWASE